MERQGQPKDNIEQQKGTGGSKLPKKEDFFLSLAPTYIISYSFLHLRHFWSSL